MTSSDRSVSERIREGDSDAILRFRAAHSDRLRSYCEAVCAPALVEEAAAAAFVDFLGRVVDSRGNDQDLDQVLRQAVRAAVASRIHVEAGHADCLAMPELLAARANDELLGDDRLIREHLRDCPVCQATRTRLQRAARVFESDEATASPVIAPEAAEPAPASEGAGPAEAAGPAELAPAPEPGAPAEAAPGPAEFAPAPAPAEPAPPVPPPEAAPTPEAPTATHAAPIVVRRRTGGVVGAVRKRLRPPGS